MFFQGMQRFGVRKRGMARSPVLPYAAILATEPDLFVGLEYAVIGSQQVLWQDAAGTTAPVTAIDDPIGCVRHPITGAIVASQATASRRPLWKGPGEGALFDGVDDALLMPAPNLPVWLEFSGTLVLRFNLNGSTANSVVAGVTTASAERVSLTANWAGGSALRYDVRNNEATLGTISTVLASRDSDVFAAIRTGHGGGVTTDLIQNEEITTATLVCPGLPVLGLPMGIGCRYWTFDRILEPYSGRIMYVSAYSRPVLDAELTSIRGSA